MKKRVLDLENEEKLLNLEDPRLIPALQSLLLNCDNRENLLLFLGQKTIAYSCYINSVFQVFYFCLGLKCGVKYLFNIISMKKETGSQAANSDCCRTSLACSKCVYSLSLFQVDRAGCCSSQNTDRLTAQLMLLVNVFEELNLLYKEFRQHDAQEPVQ